MSAAGTATADEPTGAADGGGSGPAVSAVAAEVPAELRADVRRLGDLLGQVLVEAVGEDLRDDVEALRSAAISARRGDGDAAAPRRLVDGWSLERAEQVARSFTVFFQLVNLAEERHRVRALRAGDRLGSGLGDEGDPRPGTLADALARLHSETGDDGVRRALEGLRVHPVLTAHPTQIRRRAVVTALERVREQLARLDDPRAGASVRVDARRHLLEEVTVLWHTAQLRRDRPGPLDEVRSVLAVFDSTLFRVVPRLYRAVEAALPGGPAEPGAEPSPVPAFLRIGSWVGGDRDGNPNVTAGVTREAVVVQADLALRALERTARRIGRTLTLDETSAPPSAALAAALDVDAAEQPQVLRRLQDSSPGAPHRVKVLMAAERVAATRRRDADLGYRDVEGLVADLRLVQESLAAAGAARAAYGELQHLVWQAETFGLTLAALEVRQSSSVHARVVREALEAAGQPDHPAIRRDDDPDAAAPALDALARDGWPDGARPGSDVAREVLATMRTVAGLQARWGERVCRRYVISHTESSADLAAVRALARLAVPDGPPVLQVVGLLESVEDLERGVDVLDAWLDLPGEAAAVDAAGRRLEVMLGYSDSAKGAGPVTANVVLHSTVRRLVDWAARRDLTLTLFHGRGGALGRGGGPANRAVLAQPPGSVSGTFKVTEQGEIVTARYGDLDIAERHLEQVTAATLLAGSPAHQRRSAEAAERHDPVLATASAAAHEVWTALVGSPGFADFVQRATPLVEIGELRVGSRPSSRPDSGKGLGALRAIPWVTSWAQARVNLPGWYGFGTGLAAARAEHGDDAVRAAAQEHPLLAVLLENAAMSLAKTDDALAGEYLALGGREKTARMVPGRARARRPPGARGQRARAAARGPPRPVLRGAAARPVRRRAQPPAAAGAAGAARRADGDERGPRRRRRRRPARAPAPPGAADRPAASPRACRTRADACQRSAGGEAAGAARPGRRRRRSAAPARGRPPRPGRCAPGRRRRAATSASPRARRRRR